MIPNTPESRIGAVAQTAVPELYELFLNFIRYASSSGLLSSASNLPHREQATFQHTVQESLRSRHHRRPSTLADLRSYANRMLALSNWQNRDLRGISRADCRQLLQEHFAKSAHVYCKARTILHSFFVYGYRQGWCDFNPVTGIESMQVQEETVRILSMRQVRALRKAMALDEFRSMAAAVRLMLWCGVRPGEVQRLRWKDIDPREGVVYIDARSSKTGGARAVPLRGGAAVLRQCRDKEPLQYIAPRNWQHLWAALRLRAGMHHWQQDALRHTFASYHLKFFHNIHLLQEEMGHRDSTLLRTRYLNLRNLSSRAASLFFNMQ